MVTVSALAYYDTATIRALKKFYSTGPWPSYLEFVTVLRRKARVLDNSQTFPINLGAYQSGKIVTLPSNIRLGYIVKHSILIVL
jgi:hypothetical protein